LNYSVPLYVTNHITMTDYKTEEIADRWIALLRQKATYEHEMRKRGETVAEPSIDDICNEMTAYFTAIIDRHIHLKLKNAGIFKEITGVDVNEEDEVDVTVEGKTTRISRKSAIALGFLKD